MARPLKQWLYKHRDNPYPTKTEKILLALGSQMTLVQVTRAPPGPSPGERGGAGTPPCLFGSPDKRQAPEKDRAEKSQPVTLLLRMMRVGPGAELCCGKGFWVSSQPYQFQEGSHGVLLGRTVESQLKSHEKLSGNLDLWTLYRWVQVD